MPLYHAAGGDESAAERPCGLDRTAIAAASNEAETRSLVLVSMERDDTMGGSNASGQREPCGGS